MLFQQHPMWEKLPAVTVVTGSGVLAEHPEETPTHRNDEINFSSVRFP